MNPAAYLREQLNKFCSLRTVILGIGNTLKGDDGAGPQLCNQLVGRTSAEVIDAGTVPENYIGPIVKKAPHNLLIIDAIDFAAQPGTIRFLSPEVLIGLSGSTHSPSPQLFVDLIRKEIPVDVHFIGIQPIQTELGRPLSPEVDRAVRLLADMLAEIFPLET
jgi:hydrogenase 3 maturation protease